MRGLLLVGMALVISVGAPKVMGDPVFYTDEAAWLAVVQGDVQYFATTLDNIEKADEALPAAVLTWQAANTGLSRSFRLSALQPGATFFYVTDPNHTDKPGLYVGADTEYEDDDWRIDLLDGPDLTAFGFDLIGNDEVGHGGGTDEAFEIFDTFGNSLGRLEYPDIPTQDPYDPLPTSKFLGVITSVPIGHIIFDEDSEVDDIVIADFRFVPVPEPSTMLLMLSGCLWVIRRRR